MNLDVKIVNDGADTISESLGIDNERLNEMHEFLDAVLKNSGNFVEALESLNKFVKHPNELAFMAYVIGSYAGKQSDPFFDFLRFLGGTSETG